MVFINSIRVEDLDQTADTSVDQSIVERSADASNLDIDTPSSSAKKPKKRAIKRKAEESPEKAPPTKAAKTSESGKKSRSGRPIKEKKVDDDDSAVSQYDFSILLSSKITHFIQMACRLINFSFFDKC